MTRQQPRSRMSPRGITVLRRLWEWLRGRNRADDPILLRNEEHFRDFDPDRPIESYEFLSFDTELTGLNPRKDEIVSIGAVRIVGMRIVLGDNFLSYVRPSGELPKDSTLIHKITPDKIRDAPDPVDILPDFVGYCGSSILVGHYVSLDVAFLNKALRKHMGGVISNPCVDSMRLARALHELKRRAGKHRLSLETSFNLGALAREHGLPIFEQHDALEDAIQTAYLFVFLVQKLREAGFVTLRDFYQAGRIGPRGH